MSDIPYPHKCEVWRTTQGGAGGSLDDLDSWGNPKFDAGDTAEAADEPIPCWIQEKSQKEIAELASLAEAGSVVSTHTIFMEVRTFEPSDYLVTVEGGGQPAGLRFRVLYARNPDGGTDHLEVDALKVERAQPQ